MTQRNRRPTARRSDMLRRTATAPSTAPSMRAAALAAGRTPPSPARREPLGPEIFGRRPFAPDPELRYFGTGVAGYQSGPGFTGGYYGYGDQPPDIPTELEREYAYDVYGEASGQESAPVTTAHPPSEIATRGVRAHAAHHPKRARKYLPGPKGYQRSDERMYEDICDTLLRAEHIDSSQVTVKVTAANAILDGTVPVRWMKHAIEDLADACPGINDVENRIRVSKIAPNTP